MKVSFKKPLVAGATDTQYSSNFQPIVERVRCSIVSKPIEGNCQLVDRRRSAFVDLQAASRSSSPRCFYKHVAVPTAR